MGYFDDVITKETQEERDTNRRQIQSACADIYSLLIPQLIISIASTLLNNVPVVGLLLDIATIVISIIYAAKLLKAGNKLSSDLKVAAYITFVAMGLPFVSSMISIVVLSINPYGPNDMYVFISILEIVVLVIAYILEIIALRKETDGFYFLIRKYNPNVAEYFNKVFTNYLIAMIILIIGTFITIVIPLLGLVIMVVALVFAIIAYVNKFKAYSYGSYFSDVMGE